MEVHKPKLLHNWRDLLKEWGIIVLGVLTALFAEQAVQSFEWHQKVDAAIADMYNELTRGNGPQAYARPRRWPSASRSAHSGPWPLPTPWRHRRPAKSSRYSNICSAPCC